MMKKFYLCLCIGLFSMAMYGQQRVVVGLTGDIKLGQVETLPHKKNTTKSTADYFSNATMILRDADLTIGNLEGSFLDGTTKSKQGSAAGYKMPVSMAKELKDAGFDIFTVANNHNLDFGDEGKNSTINALKAAGIGLAGFKGGYEYTSVVKNGIKVAVCAFGYAKSAPSINDIPKATELIRLLKTSHDVVIVSIHGGLEGGRSSHVPFKMEKLMKEERGDVNKFAHACIDAGASLVYGHGPGVPRALELYKGRLIAYSLGNFCTPYNKNLRNAYGFAPLLKVEITRNGSFLSGRIYSFIQKHGVGPVIDDKNQASLEMAHLTKVDFPQTDLVILREGWISKMEKTAHSITTKTSAVEIEHEYNPVFSLINYAKSLLGSRYARGHSGNGAYDCSGFTKAVYSKIGYKLNPSSRAQYTQGRFVDKRDLRPGDLVFWRNGRSIGHVGMVIEVKGTNSFKFIHAANSGKGVVIDSYPGPYYSARYVGARRILP